MVDLKEDVICKVLREGEIEFVFPIKAGALRNTLMFELRLNSVAQSPLGASEKDTR